MVCFYNYKVRVPKVNLETYIEYILKGLYNLKDDDFWWLEKKEISGYKNVTLVRETDEFYDLEFRLCTFTALHNALPKTIRHSDKVFFEDETIITAAVDRISNMIRSALDDVARYSREIVNISPNQMLCLIRHLANTNIIQRYTPLDIEGYYLCSARGVPFFLGSVSAQLICQMTLASFDADNGFVQSDYITHLNDSFQIWKENGDLSAPILPPNNLTLY